MEKSQERLQQLLQGYFEQTITIDENNELWEYFQDPKYLEEIGSLLPDAFDTSINGAGLDENRKQTILQYIFSHSGGTTSQVTRIMRLRIWSRIAAIAAVVALIVSVVYFFNYNHRKSNGVESLAYKNDVAPGKVGATLTLANGKKISLATANNGVLANEAGMSITKTADGRLVYSISSLPSGAAKQSYNTLSTAKGETYILTLPDKSKVWINAASSLTYSTALNERGQRRVKLNGEAYFEIAKDKAHPFIAESKGQEVEVLGTHFNINAYTDEPGIKTTLLEGSVKVIRFMQGTRQTQILKPGQQSLVADHNPITISNVEAEDAVAWKDGLFIFSDEPLESIMNKISRWYNVEVIYQDVDKTLLFGGGVSRFENISKVLEKLELTGLVHFKIEGRRVFVKK